MLTRSHKLALYMEGSLGVGFGKLGHGVLRYSPNEVGCVIDSTHEGKRVQDVYDSPRDCPVVATVAEAIALGCEVFVLGIAPPGGLIPEAWWPHIDEAVNHGMHVVNGLHDLVGPRYRDLGSGQWIWDIRIEPEGLKPATGAARSLSNRRILFIGTDMAVGKMTAGLELQSALNRQGVRTAFVATGQIGILLTGKGVPLDAVRVDFAGGAIEREVMDARDAEIIIIEGQGSLLHPGSTATLPLLRGSMPTDLILCAWAHMDSLQRIPEIKIPPLDQFVNLYQDLASVQGTFPRPRWLGTCLGTPELAEADAIEALRSHTEKYGVPCVDPVRFGVDSLVQAILTHS